MDTDLLNGCENGLDYAKKTQKRAPKPKRNLTQREAMPALALALSVSDVCHHFLAVDVVS